MSTISHDCRISVRQLPTVHQQSATCSSNCNSDSYSYLVIICKHKASKGAGERCGTRQDLKVGCGSVAFFNGHSINKPDSGKPALTD